MAAANMAHIVAHSVQPYWRSRQRYDSQAFEAYVYQSVKQLAEQIGSSIWNDAILQSTMLLTNSAAIVQCISAGLIPPLLKALESESADAKVLALRAVCNLCSNHLGASPFVAHGGLPYLTRLLEDPSLEIRGMCLKSLSHLCSNESSCTEMTKVESAPAKLLEVARTGEASCSTYALLALEKCLWLSSQPNFGQRMVKNSDAISVVRDLIRNGSTEALRVAAAKTLCAFLSTSRQAKVRAVECDCIPTLLAILAERGNTFPSLIVPATNCLTAISLLVEAKMAILERGGVHVLTQMLSEQKSDMRLMRGVVQCLYNLRESPEGFQQMEELKALELLKRRQDEIARIDALICK